MSLSTSTDVVEGRRGGATPVGRAVRRGAAVAAVTGVVAGLSVMSAAVSVAAPTCSDSEIIDVAVHGEHVVGDYVTGTGHTALMWPPAGQVGAIVGGRGPAVAGGPGPGFHFANGVAPGASFCLAQAGSPGFPHDR